ncbi:MAG: hypothetical protein R6V73_00890 [Anaerolineales bacterium]
MSEQSPLRNPLLPAVLLTGIIFGLIYVAVRAAATLPIFQPEPLAALPTMQLSPSASPLPTGTETPTARPTWTIRPSATPTHTSTPTSTPTATLYPSLTPARPLQYNDLYRLKQWTSEQADGMVSLLQDYPEARFRTAEERRDPRFNEAYYYPAFAYQETLLRFPEDALAQTWKWALGYNLARNAAPQTGAYYADLIAQALKSGETRLSNLPAWFKKHERRLELEVITLSAPAGYSSSHILQISGGGGAFIWLLGQSTAYETYLLTSKFDFAADLTGGFATGDLTGDGADEVIIFYSPTPQSTLLANPQVFSLLNTPPTELSFSPSIPFDLGAGYDGNWQFLADPSQGQLLQFATRILPACPVDITRLYRWDAGEFKLESTNFAIQPEPNIVEYCEITVEHAARLWGYDTSAQFMEAVLPYWPPVRKVDGRLYAADARDEWLYRLGIAHTLAGNEESAKAFLQEALDFPSIPAGQWLALTQDFLDVYQSGDDLYQACRQSPACDPRAAMEMQVSKIPLERYTSILSDLREFGITVRSSGLFDFDQDGQPERWIILRHQESQKLELWILARSVGSIHALFVDVVDTAQPSLRYSDSLENPPIVQMQLGQGFKLERLPNSGQPFLTHHNVEFIPTTYTLDTLDGAILALFSGEAPASVLQTLEDLQASNRFNCLNFRICDRFYYLLGLAYELNGRESDAINTYVKLWWEYRDSPFTTMARLKLEPISRVTPVPTSTPTETPSSYPIPIWTPSGPIPYPIPSPTDYSPYPTP